MKKTLLLAAWVLLITGCASYRPGQITKNAFGGLADDGAILRVPTPYGVALRIGETTNMVRVTAEGEIVINGKN